MKTFQCVLLVLCTGFLLVAMGCNKDDNNITNPAEPFEMSSMGNYDWVMFLYCSYGQSKQASMTLQLYWNGEPSFVEPDTIQFLVDNETVPLWQPTVGAGYYTAADYVELEPGQSYQFQLKVNGVSKFNKNCRICYPCNSTFPETFNPHNAMTMTWELEHNNSFQFVEIDASSYSPKYNNRYTKFISSSDRSFTLPANTLNGVDTGYVYDMYLYQIETYTDNTALLNCYWGNFYYYWPQIANTQSPQIDPIRINKLLQKHLAE